MSLGYLKSRQLVRMDLCANFDINFVIQWGLSLTYTPKESMISNPYMIKLKIWWQLCVWDWEVYVIIMDNGTIFGCKVK